VGCKLRLELSHLVPTQREAGVVVELEDQGARGQPQGGCETVSLHQRCGEMGQGGARP
jgi:hypothetical protein